MTGNTIGGEDECAAPTLEALIAEGDEEIVYAEFGDSAFLFEGEVATEGDVVDCCCGIVVGSALERSAGIENLDADKWPDRYGNSGAASGKRLCCVGGVQRYAGSAGDAEIIVVEFQGAGSETSNAISRHDEGARCA